MSEAAATTATVSVVTMSPMMAEMEEMKCEAGFIASRAAGSTTCTSRQAQKWDRHASHGESACRCQPLLYTYST